MSLSPIWRVDFNSLKNLFGIPVIYSLYVDWRQRIVKVYDRIVFIGNHYMPHNIFRKNELY